MALAVLGRAMQNLCSTRFNIRKAETKATLLPQRVEGWRHDLVAAQNFSPQGGPPPRGVHRVWSHSFFESAYVLPHQGSSTYSVSYRQAQSRTELIG